MYLCVFLSAGTGPGSAPHGHLLTLRKMGGENEKVKSENFHGLRFKNKKVGGRLGTKQNEKQVIQKAIHHQLTYAQPLLRWQPLDKFSPDLLLIMMSDGVEYGWSQLCWLCLLPASSLGGLHEKQKSPCVCVSAAQLMDQCYADQKFIPWLYPGCWE